MKNVEIRPAMQAILLLGLCFGIGGCDFFVSAEQRLEKAKVLYEAKDYRTASIELKKLLRNEPENLEARILLGEAQLLLGSTEDAESQFQKVLDAGVSIESIAIPLAHAYLANAKHELLLNSLNADMVVGTDSKARLLTLRGKALIELRRLTQAESEFQQSIALVPDYKDGMLGLARTALITGDFEKADLLLARVLRTNADFTEALVVKAQSLMLRQRYSEAEKAFVQLLKEDSFKLLPIESFIISVGLAESQYRQGMYKKMSQSVKVLTQKYPQHPMPKYLHALAEYSLANYKQAVEHLQNLLAIAPDYPAAQFLMGASSYALNNLEQANQYLNKAVEIEPENKQAQKLLAITYMRLNQPDKATGLMQSMLNDNQSEVNDSDLLMMLGKASLQAGDIDSGLGYIERSAKNNSSNPKSQLELAAAYIASGKMDLGVDILEGLPQSEEHRYRKDMLLVLANVKKRDLPSALNLVGQMVDKYKNNFAVLSLAGSVSMLANENEKAKQFYQRAALIDPENVGAMINLGRLNVVQGNVDIAIQKFKQAVKKQPNNLTALSLLAGIAVSEKRFDDAESHLLAAVNTNPDSAQAKVSLVKFYLLKKEYQTAEKTAAAALSEFAGNDLLVSGLAAALLGQQKPTEAATVLSQAIDAGSKSPLLFFNLARVQLILKKVPEAKELLEQALEYAPDNTTFIALLATLESQLGDYEAALRLIRAAEGRQLNTAQLSELKGDLLVQQKKFLPAKQAYGKALALKATGRLHIKGFQAAKLGALKPSVEPLLEWIGQNPEDSEVRLFLAQYYQSSGNPKAAIKLYVELLQENEDNVVALNNLAWLYHLEDNSKAVETAEKAYQLRPNDGAIIDTLGWILVERQEYDRGVGLLRKAVKAAPTVPAIQYHLAVGLSRWGDVESARELLGRLLKAEATFQERGEAEKLYAKLR